MEPDGCQGKLVTMDFEDQKNTEYIASDKGNYMHLFDAVYHTIRDNALYPITEEHIAWQIEMLAILKLSLECLHLSPLLNIPLNEKNTLLF